MRRSRSLLIALIAFAALMLGILSLHDRQDVPLEQLLVDDPAFPRRWNYGTETIEVAWEERVSHFSLSGQWFRSESNLGRVWTEAGEESDIPFPSPNITQFHFRYENALLATVQYLLSRPEITYRDDWPNFSLPYNRERRQPSEWDYRSGFTDQDHIVCAMGTPDGCQIWFYWARYGQYILEVRFFAANQGMNAQMFSTIAAEIDEHVGKQLE